MDKEFPSKSICTDNPPQCKTQEYMDNANEQYLTITTKKQRQNLCIKTGCKGPNALRNLPEHDRYKNTPVEPMHTLKNVSERVVKLITGISDSVKVREDECTRNRFVPPIFTTLTYEKGLPTAKFRLSRNELKIANERALSVLSPEGYDWVPVEIFKEGVHLKSVRWLQILSCGVLKYCIRGLLGDFQRKTLYELSDVVSKLVDEEINPVHLDKLEYRVHRVLSLLERDFPVSIQVVMLHLLHHLPFYIRRFGPVYGYWMFPVERFNSWIARRALNRRYPESTVLETYRLYEISFLMKIMNMIPSASQTDISEVDSDNKEDSQTAKILYHEHELSSIQFLALGEFYSSISDTFLENISKTVRVCSRHKKVDHHNRTITYSTKRNSHIICSHPRESSDDSPNIQVSFGDITLVFEHSFNGHSNKLLFVEWFKDFEVDTECNLIHVTDKSIAECTVVSPETVSRPLIHAYEANELWILNYL